MNKTELIDALAGKSGLTKADAGRAVDGVMEIITEALARARA
jgi:DNA-binding protein HU-beta